MIVILLRNPLRPLDVLETSSNKCSNQPDASMLPMPNVRDAANTKRSFRPH